MTAPRTTERPGLDLANTIVVVALPVLILVQAALAGQHLFEGMSITVHGVLGEVTFALTVVGVALAVLRKSDGLGFGLAVALMALAFAQVGLGFVGRDTAAAAAWHIPLGVTILGLASYQLSTLRGARPGR